MAAVKVRWNVDDVVGATILAETGAALDRAQRLAVLMDGAAPGVASGQVSARILDALTKAHSAAMAIFTDGVDRLDLEKTIAAPVRRQGGV
jgi:hypothetical protein